MWHSSIGSAGLCAHFSPRDSTAAAKGSRKLVGHASINT